MRLLFFFSLISLLSFIISPAFAAGGESEKSGINPYSENEKSENAKNEISSSSVPRYIAVLPAAGEEKESDRNDIRLSFHNVLSATDFELLKPTEIDRQLTFLTNGKNIGDFTNSDIAKHLRVDGLLLVELSKQQKIYAGAYASYTVGIKAHLYSLQSDSIIWNFDEEKTERDGGVSLNPLSMVVTAVTSSQVLKDSVRLQLIDQITRKFVNEIPKPQVLANKEQPSKIISAYSNAVESPFKSGKEIKVQMEGESGLKALVKISNTDITFPLNENDEGIYMGRYIIKTNDNITNGNLTVFANKRLKKWTQWQVPGLVTIDNIAPEKIRQGSATLQGEQVSLSWNTPNNELSTTNSEQNISYIISRSNKNKGIFQELITTRTNNYIDSSITPGEEYLYHIVAVDVAGNKSANAEIQIATVRLGPTPLESNITTSKILAAAGSPYILGKLTKIPRNITLTIKPGTTFKIEDNSTLQIFGSIKSLGTEGAPIVFYANNLSLQHEFNGGLENNYIHTLFSGKNNNISITDTSVNFNNTQFNGSTLQSRGNAKINIEDSSFYDGNVGLIGTSGSIVLNHVSFNKLTKAIENSDATISANALQFGENSIHITSTNPITLEKPIFNNDDYTGVRKKLPANIIIHWADAKSGTNLYSTWEQQHWQTLVDLAQQQKWPEAAKILEFFEPSQLIQDLIDTIYLLQNPSAKPPANSNENTMVHKFADIPTENKASLVWLPSIETSKGFSQDYLAFYYAKELAGGVLDQQAIKIEPLYQYFLPYNRGTLTLVNKSMMDEQLQTFGFLREPNTITKSQIIMPFYDSLCLTPLVWRYGKKPVSTMTKLNEKSCFSLQIESAKDTDIYLFAFGSNNKLYLLEPNTCQYNHLLSNKIVAGKLLTIPKNAEQQSATASLTEWPFSQLFLTLITDSNSIDSIQSLIDNATPICNMNEEKSTTSIEAITKILSIADIKTGGKIQWQQLPLGIDRQ